MAVKNLSLRKRKSAAKNQNRGVVYQSHAAVEATRTLKKIDRAAVMIVTMVVKKAQRNGGSLYAYDGVEAAREARSIITKLFAEFSRSETFRRMASHNN